MVCLRLFDEVVCTYCSQEGDVVLFVLQRQVFGALDRQSALVFLSGLVGHGGIDFLQSEAPTCEATQGAVVTYNFEGPVV